MSRVSPWESFTERIVVTGVLTAESALRVGASSSPADPVAPDLPVYREAGEVVLPGSSLRGALRSYLEAVLRSLEPEAGHGRGACDPLHEPCVPVQRVAELQDEFQRNPRAVARAVVEESCRLCRVFGSPQLASRLRILDAHPLDPPRAFLRDGIAIERDLGTVQNKYDYEAVATGARFGFHLEAENLEPAEAGLVDLLLGELEEGRVPVGGFRGRGLGKVRLTDVQILRFGGGREELIDYLRTGRGAEVGAAGRAVWREALIADLSGDTGHA